MVTKIKWYSFFSFIICLQFASNAILGQGITPKFNGERSKKITLIEFQNRVDRATLVLKTKRLSAISDTEHINIIKCLNTIRYVNGSLIEPKFNGTKYQYFEAIIEKKDYCRDITKVYPRYSWNTGMGYYLKKLKIELGGLPSPNSMFDVAGEHVR